MKKSFNWESARKRAKHFKKLGRNYEVADYPEHPVYNRAPVIGFTGLKINKS
tara:strand:+ start:1218 stop:1373 length:156 start_codon:yes stop_codon:yes gene_type:complete